MKIKISKAQRGLFFGLAAIISIILFQQIEDEGLDDSPWLTGSLIIGGLLFFALAPLADRQPDKQKRPSPRQVPPKSHLDALSNLAHAIPTIDERYDPVARLYRSTYREWSAFFSSSVVDRLSRMSRTDMNHMRKFSELAAITMTFSNVMFFLKGEQAKAKNEHLQTDGHVVRILATNDLSQQIQYTLGTSPAALTDEQGHPKVIRSLAMKKLEAYEIAVNESIGRYVAHIEYPFDPLFAAVDKEAHFKLSDAERREDFFGIKFREEIGRLVRDTSNQ